MKKNKFYIFILTIMVTASCLFLGGCVSEEQIDKFAEKYPGAFVFAVSAFLVQMAKGGEFREAEDEDLDGTNHTLHQKK